jgi:hypothetical protein
MAAHTHKSVSGFPLHPINGFARRLINDLTLIESRCKLCGELIVDSVMNGLPDKEAEHLEYCPAAKPPKCAH